MVSSFAARQFAERFGTLAGSRTWWVPGRIELFGKHVDYAGGRSLLVAIDRGITIVARPRDDGVVELHDAVRHETFRGVLRPDLPPAPGDWRDYPISVLRRIARDMPPVARGMDAVIASSIPPAAGVSSSSALVIATFLPLAAFNALASHPAWPGGTMPAELAGYLGAVENGRGFGHTAADFGVGTQGGSQDHLAILCCRAGHVTQARFLPSQVEREVAWPADWSLVVAASGVHAAKSAGTREHYNTLSRQAESLRTLAGTASLLDFLASDPGATARLADALSGRPDAAALASRLAQFREECLELIPGAVAAIAAGDAVAFGDRITRSATLGATALDNQVPETLYLAESAPAFGAVAASPFGAGFGGSVYALVPTAGAEQFATRWAAGYRDRFPVAAGDADFFVTTPSAGAHEVT